MTGDVQTTALSAGLTWPNPEPSYQSTRTADYLRNPAKRFPRVAFKRKNRFVSLDLFLPILFCGYLG